MAILQYGRIVWPIVIFVATGIWLRKALRQSQLRDFSSKNQCKPPSHSASKLPWGIDRMWRMVKLTAKHADVMETVIMPGFAEHGWTFTSTGLFGTKMLLTADPENMRAIFSTQFQDFPVGPNRTGAFGYMVGKCIFTTDGPFWEHSRTLFKPHFGRGEINDLDITERGVQEFLHAVLAHGTDDNKNSAGESGRWTNVVDLQQLFLRFTLDAGTEFLFGTNVKSQLAAMPGVNLDDKDIGLGETTRLAADKAGGDMTFTEAFHIATLATIQRAKLQNLYWLADTSKGRKAVQYLRNFIDHLVGAQLKERKQEDLLQHSNEKLTLLQALAKDTSDPIELRDQTLFLLTASRDTTAALLSWMFLMFAKFPDVFQKLRTEIIKEFGTKDEPQEVTFYRLKKCLYLQWTMFETLRLYPPGPLNSRIAARDTTLPTGGGPDGKSPIIVPEGQTINICVYAMHRRTDLWGDDAMEYKPERWNGRKTDWAFLPFSGGPRVCLGKEYALAEAGFLTVRLLQHFDSVEAVQDLTNIEQFVTATLEPTHGVKVRLRKAAE
ncbi:cytochrome P450 [Trichoderma velutinum]